MSRYPLGQPCRVSTTVKDVTGTLVDAGALTLLVKTAAADGTWTTTGTYASPAHDGTGLYHQDIPVTDLATAGHYQYTWTCTGTGAGVSFGEFDVFDPFETSILPLAGRQGPAQHPAGHHHVRRGDRLVHRHDPVRAWRRPPAAPSSTGPSPNGPR